MKKAVVVAVSAVFFVSMISQAQAWGAKKKKADEAVPSTGTTEQTEQTEQAVKKQEPQVKKVDKAQDKALDNKRAAVQKKLAELNNTEWQIELNPLGAAVGKSKKEAETVTFKNSQVMFSNFGKKGFPATNFTLTIQDDGIIVWETMQTAEKAGTAFWRGELNDNMQEMRGIVSHQIDAKTKQDFSFISTARKSIPAAAK
jgi:membrane-associated HD superfamily phosphohydrolase